ncbi:hypothetical protein F5B20DRAFT_567478 [Whalleya microplaca]|nr:hypothetical protein F5B20DRAFT_567478 [Whalleya microplaca]
MATFQNSNYLPYIQQHLDAQGESNDIVLEIECDICQSRLDISRSARTLASSEKSRADLLLSYSKHDLERTVALPCGHVFGESCIGERSTGKDDLTCPSCDFKMVYKDCSHAIAPILIPVKGHNPIRDTFPLTIPEDGREPSNCKECRWKSIQPMLRRILDGECAICRQQSLAGLPLDLARHLRHRDGHINSGLKAALTELMDLIWPKFETRETESSLENSTSDNDRRQVNLSLFYAIVVSKVEDTVWNQSETQPFSREQSRKHAHGVESIEQTVLGWVMGSSDSRRMW